jgi:hypothetical protein
MLEECLQAERQVPGSSAAIVERAQGQLRLDLQHLLPLALDLHLSSPRLLDAGSIAEDRKNALRARVMQRIGGDRSRE